VTDPHSTSNDKKEPPRNRTVPADFIWDPETESWSPPGEVGDFDADAWLRDFQKLREELRNAPPIPEEQLRVPPGTLDVPPAWRKSLGGDRDLFSDVIEDDEKPEKQQQESIEPDN